MTLEQFKKACEEIPDNTEQNKKLLRLQDLEMRDIEKAKKQVNEFMRINKLKMKADKMVSKLEMFEK